MRLLGRLCIAALCLLLLAPIVIVVIVSFSGDTYLTFPPSTFALRWYARFLGDEQWRNALWNSLLVAALCSIFATSIGFCAAYAFERASFFGKSLLMGALLLPLVIPSIVTAVAVYYFSIRLGLVGNRVWLAITHTILALPIVMIIARAALKTVDPELERAAAVHGCGNWGVLWRVVLPIAAPGIISGALFAFLTSFDELIIAIFVSGANGQTLPVRIWNSLTIELEPTIAAVSTLLVAVTVVILLADAYLRTRYLGRGNNG
jgi:putative spermidine/putrescine transport system permease protein